MYGTETRKLLVSKQGLTLFECPHCKGSKSIDVGRFRHLHAPVKIRCSCGVVLSVSLEWRRTDRKETYLEAYVAKVSRHRDWNKVLVKNITAQGIGLTALATPDLKEGDHISLTLTVQNGHAAKLEKDATVRFVKDSYLGCEFAEPLRYEEAQPLGVVS